MGEWKFTLPDGSVFNATADSWEEAQKGVRDQISQEKVDAAKKAYEDAPPLSKARMVIGDPSNQLAHGMTAGLFDKGFDLATGGNSAAETEAGAARMGPVATGIARTGGAMMLPSAAPRAVAAVGGGPLVRGLTGAGVAGVEQGTYGGINAATSPPDPMTGKPTQSIPAGILSGVVGGALGQAVGQGVGDATNKTFKWWKGVNDAAPARNITQIPQGVKNPSTRDLVDIAAATATSTGARKGTAEATQAAQKAAFEDLLTGKYQKQLTPTQKARMKDIAYGDPGTNLANVIGGKMQDKLTALSLGGGVGAATGGIVPGLLTTGGMIGGGKALTVDSAKATQEAVDRLRQLIYKKTPFRGPLSADRVRTIGQALGYGGMQGIQDYIE